MGADCLYPKTFRVDRIFTMAMADGINTGSRQRYWFQFFQGPIATDDSNIVAQHVPAGIYKLWRLAP